MPEPRLEPISVPSTILPKPSATYMSPIVSSAIGQLLLPLTRPSRFPSAVMARYMSRRSGMYCAVSARPAKGFSGCSIWKPVSNWPL